MSQAGLRKIAGSSLEAHLDLWAPLRRLHSLHRGSQPDLELRLPSALLSTPQTINSALKVAGRKRCQLTSEYSYRLLERRSAYRFCDIAAPTTVLRGGYGLSFFPGNYTSNADLKNAPLHL